VRALKRGMQGLAKELGVDTGFLFKQQPAFEAGIEALQGTDPLLAEYMRQTRTWSEPLIESRNAIEHRGWSLPRVACAQQGGSIGAIAPEILGQPFTAFIDTMLDRLCCFVEEFTAHGLQRRMVPEITVTELPLNDRPAEAPERFRLRLDDRRLAPLEYRVRSTRVKRLRPRLREFRRQHRQLQPPLTCSKPFET